MSQLVTYLGPLGSDEQKIKSQLEADKVVTDFASNSSAVLLVASVKQNAVRSPKLHFLYYINVVICSKSSFVLNLYNNKLLYFIFLIFIVYLGWIESNCDQCSIEAVR